MVLGNRFLATNVIGMHTIPDGGIFGQSVELGGMNQGKVDFHRCKAGGFAPELEETKPPAGVLYGAPGRHIGVPGNQG